jgi:polysaccharide biosynthesis protein PslG
MVRFVKQALLLVGWGSAFYLAAAALPPPLLPEGVGVNIHFVSGHERDLDLIAAGGFRYIRMDFGWAGIERAKGQYDWASYDELVSNLEKRHLRAIFILDYSNGLYEPEILSKSPLNGEEQRTVASPQKPESVAAYARWAAAAARHFQGRAVIWEIWNEPNIGFWKPKPDVRQYTALALAACKAIREVDSGAVIIGPASSEFPWTFLDVFLSSGVLNCLDAVSVHPYRAQTREPETVSDDYLKLRALIERYTPAGRQPVPIVSSEWGYSSHTKGVSPSTQAAFLVRQQLVNLLNGVPISIWYDWKNDGTNPVYNEDNFGTVNHDLSPKPGYLAGRTLTRQFPASLDKEGRDAYHIARRLETRDVGDYVLLLVNPAGDQKLVAWTTAEPHSIFLDLDLRSVADVAGVSGLGAPLELAVSQGRLRLELEAAPHFVKLNQRNPILSAAAAWSVVGFIPTLIEAGDASRIKIPVRAGNPFSETVSFRFRLESVSGSDSKVLRVKPGQSKSCELTFRATRRTASSLPVVLSAEVEELMPNHSVRALGRSVEHRFLLIKNPLRLQVLPVEQGLRLQLDNPSGSPFEGTATVNGVKLPIRLARSETNFSDKISVAGTEMNAQVLDRAGKLVADPVACRLQRLTIPSVSAALDGDSKVPAEATVRASSAPADNPPYNSVQRLDYSFDVGWRFVRCVPRQAIELSQEGRPLSLGLWVYGDQSGNMLRARVVDEGGQTFQPSGPNLDWLGWRWVEFDLADFHRAGHWGGANDGVVHGALRLDTLLLVDSTRNKTSGAVYFAGPTVIRSP